MKSQLLSFKKLILAVALLLGANAYGQLAMTRSVFNGTYTPIVGGTLSTAAGDDAFQQNIPIGFTFNYLGTPYTQFSVSTNGWMSFANLASFDAFSPDLYSATTSAVVAPWWDDLSSSAIIYQTTGAPGSQVCTIQWTSLSYYFTSTRTINYQVKLYEGTGVIEMWYGAAPTGTINTSESASIGIKSVTGGNGQYIDAVTGSAFTGNSSLQSDRWPAYNFRFTPGAPAALPAGTYTVGVAGTYRNLNEAAADVNHRGITGAVTFNLIDAQYDVTVANGSNFFPILIGPINGSSAANTVTFTKSATAAIISYGGASGANGAIANQANTTALASNVDPIIGLVGADYVTLNNLDLRGNVGNLASDHGVGVYNSSATDGANNNTISNITVTMNRANTGSRGFVSNVITVPTAATGANSNNVFKDFTIKSVYAGIQMTGNATFPDLNTQITRTNCTTYNSIGDPATPNDIGNGTGATYGVLLTNLSGFTLANNSIRNVTNTGGQADGISIVTFQGTSSIYNNKIQTIRNAGTASTTGISGIRMTHTTTGTHTIRVYNNTISEITSGYTGVAVTARTLKGIFVAGTGGANTQAYEIYNNAVSIDGSGSLNVSSACFEVNTAIGPIYKLGNNIFANFTAAQGATSKHYIYSSPTALTFGPAGTLSSNNDLFVANDVGTSGFIGFDGTTNYNTIATWAAAMTPAGMEAASISVNPSFISNTTDLHATSLAVNGVGIAPPVYITVDQACATRTPDNDLGAYILNACTGTPTAGSITGATSVCTGSGTTLTLTGASSGAGISYQWASALTSGGPYTTLLGTSNTQATGPVTVPTYYVVGVTCSVSGQSAVTSQFTVLVNPLPTVAVTPSTSTLCLPGGSPIALTATGATTYTWGPATGLSATTGASVTANPAATTTYTVTGTNSNGCVNTATATVTVATAIVMDSVRATPAIICSGGNSVLNAYASGPAFTYCTPTYSTGTTFGDYCSSVVLNTLNSPSAGAATAPYYTLFPTTAPTTTTLVAGNTYTITLVAGTYTSNDLAAWIDYNMNGILNDGGEKLGETDNLGASPASTSFTFTVPLTAINGTTRLRVREMDHGGTNDMDPCAAQSSFGETEDYIITITGGVTPTVTYTWSPATFLSSTTGSPVNANNVTATTTYTATVTNAAGCSATGNVTLTAGAPLSATATASPATTICSGANLTLTGTPTGGGAPFTYNWTGPNSFTSNVQSPVITAATTAASGTYTLVITDNCAASFTVNVTVTVNATPTVTATPSAVTYCTPGSPVALAASGSTTYTWAPAAGLSATTGSSVTASPSASTTYTITGTSADGCSSTTTAAVTVAEAPTLATVTATPATICSGSNSQLNVTGGTTTAYTLSTRTFALEPCQATAGPTGDDALSAPVNIGFNFNFYGVTYTQFGISTNGNIQMGDGSGTANNPFYNNAWTDVAIPNNGVPNNFIALAWDDWFISAGEINYGVTGTAPNRKMIICYNTTGRGSGSADTLNGQIVLEETTNKIYMNITKKGVQPFNTATQGIEDQTATPASVGVPNRQSVAWSVNNQSIVFTPSGGPLTYAWTPATFLSSTSIANPVATAATASTTYTVSISANGCSSSGSVALTVNPLPVVTLSGNTTICANDTTVLTGSTGGTYQWYQNGVLIAGATNNTYSVTTAGVYNMVLTNSNGCSDSAATGVAVIVNALPAVTANASSSAICIGNTVTFTGGGATTYVWSNSITDAVPYAVTTTGYYVVSGTDGNGCVNTDSVMVTVNALPVVALGVDTTQCAGTITLDAGNAGASYLWNDSSVGQTLTASATGNYSVNVTDANGCSSNDSINVTINALPVVALGVDTALCATSITLDAGNAGSSYVWSDNSVGQTFTATTTGTYYVDVTDANGCSSSDSINVTVNALPVVSLGADTAQCGGSITLDAGNAGSAYVWTDNSTAQTFVAASTGTYDVTVTDSLTGCSGHDTIAVTINAIPTVALGADVVQCGGTVSLDAGTSGNTYLWNNSNTTQVITVSTSGSYDVTVSDSTTGCASSDTINVTINAIPTVTFAIAQDTICKADAALILSGSPAGGTFSGPGVIGNSFSPLTLSGLQTITYSYTDTITGCSASVLEFIFVDDCIGILENSTAQANVYPNPNLGQFTIDLGVAPTAPVTIEIMNSLGQLVQTFTMTSSTKQVDLSTYEGGMYMVRITNGSEVSMVRVVKQ